MQNDAVLPNPETHGAQDSDETAQPTEPGSNAVVMIVEDTDVATEENPDSGPDLEEQLDGVSLREIMRVDGLVDPTVTFIDANTGTPEIV